MYECNANAKPKEKKILVTIERINTRTMSDRLIETESFASRLF